jgi:hypothetical protein
MYFSIVIMHALLPPLKLESRHVTLTPHFSLVDSTMRQQKILRKAGRAILTS